MNNIQDLQARALDIKRRYAELNQKTGKQVWGPKDFAMGFVGDIGELMQLIAAKENVRPIDDVDAKLAHELADCLWCVLVLADHYDIDIEKEFIRTMDGLVERIGKASDEN
jgi:NTP pyrophosphatase (non-canonical NTP hydrolase)